MSMPALFGWVIVSACRHLSALRLRLQLRWAKACSIIRYGMWRWIGHGVETHSLKRDIGASATDRRDDSPMSMTSPRTTLTSGQCAPLLHRSSPTPHSTLPQRSYRMFLRRDLRHSGPITSLTTRSTGPAGTGLLSGDRRRRRAG